MLRSTPAEAPKPLEIEMDMFTQGNQKALHSASVAAACDAVGRSEDFQWVLQTAETAKIANLGRADALDNRPMAPESRAEWGHKYRIGVPCNSVDLPFIECTGFNHSAAEFWELPADLTQAHALMMSTERAASGAPIPNLRYKTPSQAVQNQTVEGTRLYRAPRATQTET